MATVKAVILRHQLREDKTFNVKVRLTHKRKSVYIATSIYIPERAVGKDDEIRERGNSAYMDIRAAEDKIRGIINKMNFDVNRFEAKELAEIVKKEMEDRTEGISVFKFDDSVGILGNSRMRLMEYAGPNFKFNELNYKFVEGYDIFLKEKGKKPGTIINYIGRLQYLLKRAKLEYNDEAAGIVKITVNPFERYKFPKKVETRKKALTKEELLRLYSCKTYTEAEQFAVDVFFISLLTCGTNMVDLYGMQKDKDGRIEYERKKTRGRRGDRAYISMRVQPELQHYIEEYKGKNLLFNFSENFSEYVRMARKITAIKTAGAKVGINDLTIYAARHTFATIARNDCKMRMDDVAAAMNHKSPYGITDVYIRKDFSIVDVVNRAVIDYIFN